MWQKWVHSSTESMGGYEGTAWWALKGRTCIVLQREIREWLRVHSLHVGSLVGRSSRLPFCPGGYVCHLLCVAVGRVLCQYIGVVLHYVPSYWNVGLLDFWDFLVGYWICAHWCVFLMLCWFGQHMRGRRGKLIDRWLLVEQVILPLMLISLPACGCLKDLSSGETALCTWSTF